MSLSQNLKYIFCIIAIFGMIQYKFQIRVMLRVSKKLIIIATNPLICYLIIEMHYRKLLLITKLMVISIEFKFLRKTSFVYDGVAISRESQNLVNEFQNNLKTKR